MYYQKYIAPWAAGHSRKYHLLVICAWPYNIKQLLKIVDSLSQFSVEASNYQNLHQKSEG